ncbi:hypothetical protein ACFX2A_010114 [Malus domestica]
MLLNRTNTVDYAMDIHKSLHHTEDVPQGVQIKSVVVPVPESEISGTGTPGPDFWSWEPPQGSDKGSDDIIDLPTAMKTSAQLNLSNPVLEKERSVDCLSIPLESKRQEPNRNPPLPPFQSPMEVEKVDVSEALSVEEEHELGDEFSAHAADAAQAPDTVDEASSYGVNADGSKWWKESGTMQRPDGVICKWTMTRGVSADQVTEWQDKYWEALCTMYTLALLSSQKQPYLISAVIANLNCMLDRLLEV